MALNETKDSHASDLLWALHYARKTFREYLEFLALVRKKFGSEYSIKLHKEVQQAMKNPVTEGVEMGDLKRLVEPKLTIDAYRSKMGEDKDICVVAFTVFGKDPASDLANFVEKSYDWVLDADVSSGELSDGNYLMFVELQRTPKVCDHIFTMMTDIMNLTDQELDDWKFSYYKSKDEHELTIEELARHVISTTEKYESKVDQDVTESRELDKLRAISGIQVKAKKVTDPVLTGLQIAAGIK